MASRWSQHTRYTSPRAKVLRALALLPSLLAQAAGQLQAFALHGCHAVLGKALPEATRTTVGKF